MEQIFARNPLERRGLSEKCIALIGCGSVGSTVAEIAARTGVGHLILVDPDTFALENIGRHVLTSQAVGMPKAVALKAHLLEINPDLDVTPVSAKFEGCLPQRPDLIISAVDSFVCESLVNAYSLAEGVSAIYVGVWGEARVAEICYVVPGKTACYECYASFRRKTLHVESDLRKYTDPDTDPTRVPGQPGLWANILMAGALSFHLCLGLLRLRPELIDHDRNLWLLNISQYDSPLQPLAVTFGRPQKGCAICDESKLEELRA